MNFLKVSHVLHFLKAKQQFPLVLFLATSPRLYHTLVLPPVF